MGCCSELIDVRESDVYLLVFYNDFVLCDVAFSPSTAEVKESRAGAPHHFVFVVKLLCCGWIQKAEPAASPSVVSLPNTFLFMLITRIFFFFVSSTQLQLGSVHSLCLSHSRCGHWRHVLGVALHVPGGVADGARGSGGVAGELRDLLQGEGDRLQGESLQAGK